MRKFNLYLKGKKLLPFLSYAIAASCISLASTKSAAETTYPNKPITIIVPVAAGGATDNIARALALEMSERMGQPVVVDNRPGASGIVGTNAVAKSSPDGYTVLVTLSQSVLNNLFLYNKLPYDTNRDLSFITEISGSSLILVANNKLADNSLQEILKNAASGKKYTIGTWGAGSYGHLVSSYLNETRNTEITHIPYKGESMILQDIIGEQVDFAFISPYAVKSHIESGKLKALAVTGSKRIPSMPNIPTLSEAGLLDAEVQNAGKILMLVPKKTPESVKNRLEEVSQKIIAGNAFRERSSSLGFYPIGNSSADAQASHDVQYPIQKRLTQISKAKLD